MELMKKLNAKTAMSKFARVTGVVLFLGILGVTSAQSEDDYLKMINEEVQDPVYLEKVKNEIVAVKEMESKGKKMNIADAKVSLFTFEDLLKRTSPISYSLYKDFSFAKKTEVHQALIGSNKLSTANQAILDIYTKK